MGAVVQEASLERDWLLRALVVLQRPRAVFAALRDDSDAAAEARQEPVLALVLLAGTAGVLASPVARTLLDDPARDVLVVAVWAFIGGLIYGLAVYWIGGALVHWASGRLGSQGTYRRARHLVAFAAAPLALSLVTLWPVLLALYGGGLFHDGGRGHAAAAWGGVAFGLWSLAWLAVGVRSVHAWPWPRALGATALAVGGVALVIVLSSLLFTGGR